MKQILRGILIDKTRFKDKSLIIKVLCTNGNLLSGLFYQGKSDIPLQLLNNYTFSYDSKPGRDLVNFREINSSESFYFNEIEPQKLDQYFVLAELMKNLFREEDSGQDLHAFLNVELRYFSTEFNPDFHIIFLTKLIAVYGLLPEGKFEGIYFDFREGCCVNTAPPHPDYCASSLIVPVIRFVNGNTHIIDSSNAIKRYETFVALIRFLELQKGIKLPLKSIEVLRDLRK